MTREYSSFFPHTSIILSELQKMDPSTSEIYPYLLRTAIIMFSSEIEYRIRNVFKDLLKEYLTQHLKKGGINSDNLIEKLRTIINAYNVKLRNPKIRDISETFKHLDIEILKLEDNEISIYNNVIINRNNVAHDPNAPVNVSLQEIIKAVKIGEKIVDHFNKISMTKKV